VHSSLFIYYILFQPGSAAMGKFMLAKLRAAEANNTSTQEEQPPTRNGFIHIDNDEDRAAALPRFSTAPAPASQLCEGQWLQFPKRGTKKVDEQSEDSAIADDVSTLATDNMSDDADAQGYVPIAFGDFDRDRWEHVQEQENANNQANHTQEQTPPEPPQGPMTPPEWLVDGRKLKGRDTRVSTGMHALVGDGPGLEDFVVTIFPKPASNKRGGSSFKASDSVGRVQLKSKEPKDQEVSICITVGNFGTRCQKHNFARDPLMMFLGEWDFKAALDQMSDRPTVAITLRLLPLENGAFLPGIGAANPQPQSNLDAAIMDPAIAALSLMKPTQQPREMPVSERRQMVAQIRAQLLAENNAKAHWTAQPAFQQPQEYPPYMCHGVGESRSRLFTVTIRRHDGVPLGLDVNRDQADQELVVGSVIPYGAAEAWNRVCFNGQDQTLNQKAIVPGDRIVGINGRLDCDGMLEECRNQQLLKIYIVRGDLPHEEIPYGWAGVPAPVPMIQQFFMAVPVIVPAVSYVKYEPALYEDSASSMWTGNVMPCAGIETAGRAPRIVPAGAEGGLPLMQIETINENDFEDSDCGF